MSVPGAPPDPRACLADARRAALLAWGRICHFHNGTFEVFQKPDGPATEADQLADQVIVRYLEERYPRDTYGFLSEEFENEPERLERGRVWIIDPIDGTEDFMKGRGDFAIHIALAARGEDGVCHPVVAVVYHPMAGVIYSAIRGCGAHAEHEIRAADGPFWWTSGVSVPAPANFAEPQLIRVSEPSTVEEMTAVVSKSHMTRRLRATLEALPLKGHYRKGSLGVKLMEVASGRADVYLNTERGKCKEWDLCAPQLILEEAGGRVTDLDGGRMTYNRPHVALPAGVVASNGAGHAAMLEALAVIRVLYERNPPPTAS